MSSTRIDLAALEVEVDLHRADAMRHAQAYNNLRYRLIARPDLPRRDRKMYERALAAEKDATGRATRALLAAGARLDAVVAADVAARMARR